MKDHGCAPDKTGVDQPPDCQIDYKDYHKADTLEKCQNWALMQCKANTISFAWEDESCMGFTHGCKYGEKDYYPFYDNELDFCKRKGNFLV